MGRHRQRGQRGGDGLAAYISFQDGHVRRGAGAQGGIETVISLRRWWRMTWPRVPLTPRGEFDKMDF